MNESERKKICFKRIASACAAVLFLSLLSPRPTPFPAAESHLRPGAAAETYEVTGVGFSVNVIKHEFGGVDGVPVLDLDYIHNGLEQELVKTPSETFMYVESPHETYKDFADSLQSRFDAAAKTGKGVYPFLSEIEKCFGGTLGGGQTLYGAYYYEFFVCRGIYSLSLPHADTFADSYGERLNPSFLDALDKVQTGETNYEEFFNSYGTHVAAGLEFGGKIFACYGEFSSQKSFDEAYKTKLCASLHESVADKTFRFSGFGIPASSKVHVTGGDDAYRSGLTGGSGEYEEWLASLNDENSEKIGYGDKLLPFYDVLPEAYAGLKEPMKKAFEVYARENTDLYENAVKTKPADSENSIGIDSSATHEPPNENAWKVVLGVGGGCAAAGIAAYAIVKLAMKKKKKQ